MVNISTDHQHRSSAQIIITILLLSDKVVLHTNSHDMKITKVARFSLSSMLNNDPDLIMDVIMSLNLYSINCTRSA